MFKFSKPYQFILAILAAIVMFLVALSVLAISLVSANHEQSTGIKKLFSQASMTPIVAEVSITSPSPSPEKYLVSRVIDGDTIKLENGAAVRYIGINAAEMPNQCYAQEATKFNRQLVEGKSVTLEKDISETDKYGRLLRYVYLDGVMINAKLVADGYAQVATYPPDVKYVDNFLRAQQQAKTVKLGLWAKCPVKETK